MTIFLTSFSAQFLSLVLGKGQISLKERKPTLMPLFINLLVVIDLIF